MRDDYEPSHSVKEKGGSGMSLQAIIRLLEFADTLDEVDVGMTQMWKDGVPHCFALPPRGGRWSRIS